MMAWRWYSAPPSISRHSIMLLTTSTLLIVLCFLLIILADDVVLQNSHSDLQIDDDNITLLIKSANYPAEAHEVRTRDGYYCRMHRIPSGKPWKIFNPPAGVTFYQRISDAIQQFVSKRNRTPVLLLHGLFSSSAVFLIPGPEYSLGYILADAGYDVWMGNARGTTYSKRHDQYSSDSREYWNFSWHEIGFYDLPAMISYILRVTNMTSLHFVGHSQGFTSLLVMLIMRPEYNAKIITAQALAPVVLAGNMDNTVVRTISQFIDQFQAFLTTFSLYEILPTSTFFKAMANLFCAEMSITHNVCLNSLGAFGLDPNHVNRSIVPNFFEYLPAGSSFKQLVHFGQIVRENRFQMFDLGEKEENMAIYGTVEPPEYDYEKVTAPVSLFFGGNDDLVTTVDAELLTRKLSKSLYHRRVIDNWQHADFVFGLNANEIVYSVMLQEMRKGPPQAIATANTN